LLHVEETLEKDQGFECAMGAGCSLLGRMVFGFEVDLAALVRVLDLAA